MFINTAIVVNGGPTPLLQVYGTQGNLRQPTNLHYVHKRFVSGIDSYDSITGNAWSNQHYQHILQEDQLGNIFYMGNICFGLEVCLDHSKRHLKSILFNWMDNNLQAHTSTPDVDVHILVACGMEVIRDGIVTRQGGLFVRCDGSITALQAMQGSEIGRYYGGTLYIPLAVAPDSANTGPGVQQVVPLPPHLQLKLSQHESCQLLAEHFGVMQRIVVYKQQAIDDTEPPA